MTISVITTVYNEADNIEGFMLSVLSQTWTPDEIVVVDGGSTDGTAEILRRYKGVRVHVEKFCNIRHHSSPVALGRNMAIRYAVGDIIAVTDAGCVLHPRWLAKITRPIVFGGIDVCGGLTSVIGKSYIPEPEYRDLLNASSRSLAFTREIWNRAGGYPEVVLTAEDTLFNQRLQSIGARYEYRPDAIVFWYPPNTFSAVLKQQYRYAKGDAVCGLRREFYVKKTLRALLPLPTIAYTVNVARAAGYWAGRIKGKW